MSLTLKKTEKTYVITELQRKKNSVNQLQKKLDSYQYEPKTSILFEKMAALRTELKSLSENTESLLSTLKLNNIILVDYIENVEEQFAHFNMLQTDIEQYIASVRQ